MEQTQQRSLESSLVCCRQSREEPHYQLVIFSQERQKLIPDSSQDRERESTYSSPSKPARYSCSDRPQRGVDISLLQHDACQGKAKVFHSVVGTRLGYYQMRAQTEARKAWMKSASYRDGGDGDGFSGAFEIRGHRSDCTRLRCRGALCA